MDTKHIHCMLEKISEYGKCMMEEATGSGNVNLDDAGKIVDMVKDLACAEKDALIAKEMRKAHEDDEAEEKYIRKMLKEENKDEFKRYMEEYGDDGERRFYDDWRYASGRFAPKGRGSYEPRRSGRRRGYVEPMYHMTPEMMREHDPEYWRDMDRMDGKMYYTDGNMGGNTSNSSNSGNRTGNMGGGNVRGYEEGYNDGNRRGYSEGYDKGTRDGRNQGDNSRYDKARRGYEEKKMMHNGNTPDDNKESMKGLEELLNVVGGDIKELSPNMSPSEKAMTAQKFDTWSKMLKQ